MAEPPGLRSAAARLAGFWGSVAIGPGVDAIGVAIGEDEVDDLDASAVVDHDPAIAQHQLHRPHRCDVRERIPFDDEQIGDATG